MEEVVRLVERGAREAEIPYTPASAATAPAVATPKAAPVPPSPVSEPHHSQAPPQAAAHTPEPEVVAEVAVEPGEVGGDIDEAAAR